MIITVKHSLIFFLGLVSVMGFAQDKQVQKQALLAAQKAKALVYEGNSLVNNDFVSAEMAYRQALSEQSSSAVGAYNLGHAYIDNGSLDEALFRLQEAASVATSKTEKHKAYHNIGNVLMENKKCKEAVDAYKNALRNNPSDNETRYNLALAKQCAEQQKDQNQDDNKQDNKEDQDQDNKDNQENQDKQDKGDKQDENKDPNDDGNQDKDKGDQDKDEEGKPKDDKGDNGKGDKKEDKEQPKKPQPKQGQMSPQQIKNLLEAMNNQEQKVQEKMNAKKVQGVKVQTDKDW